MAETADLECDKLEVSEHLGSHRSSEMRKLPVEELTPDIIRQQLKDIDALPNEKHVKVRTAAAEIESRR